MDSIASNKRPTDGPTQPPAQKFSGWTCVSREQMGLDQEVCRVPLDNNNYLYVAAALGGSYHESDCGFLMKCTGENTRLTADQRGVDTKIAVWYTCQTDPLQVAMLIAGIIGFIAGALVLWRRMRRGESHGDRHAVRVHSRD
jgi:hypothetical protein